MNGMKRLFVWLTAMAMTAACAAPPHTTYEVRGQVLARRLDVREVRIAHEDIPGYMPAMTMSFGVKDARLLEGLERGDLVQATLVVTQTDAWLATVTKTGHAPVIEPSEPEAAALAQAPADLLEPGHAVPDETFVDQSGQVFPLGRTRGRAVALTFIYTRCPLPTFCPRMDRGFRAAQQAVAGRPDLQGRVQFLSISFDPAFDTPDVLRQHAAAVGADLESWRFLTAEEPVIDRFATRFGVSIIRNPADPADITHNLRTAVLGPDGRLRRVLPGGDWTPEELVAELAAALAP
jgi:protein SCO1/2